MKDENLSNKYKWCTLVLVITMTVLLIRLWDLQIMRGSEMRKLSEQNRIRVKKIVAPRGIIYDRTGKVLADTRPSFNIYLTPEDIRDFSQTVDGLARLLACDREEIIEKMKAASGMPPSFPIKIKSDIPMDEVARVEAHRVYIPGVSIQIEPKRNYPYAAAFAHVIGYVSEISDEELKDKKKYKDYSPGDYIGKYGLERSYENDLRGVDGEKRVEVDAIGREVRTLDVVDPIPGHSLHLNLDLELQLAADKALETRKGAAVALNPKTGGALVVASRPGFDPNLFASGYPSRTGRRSTSTRSTPCRTGPSRAGTRQGRPSRYSRRCGRSNWASSTSAQHSPAVEDSLTETASSSAGKKAVTARCQSIAPSWNPATSSFTMSASGWAWTASTSSAPSSVSAG